MKRRMILVTMALAVFALAACKDKDNPVLAVVNGREIRQAEFDAYLTLKRIAPTDEKRREEALDSYLKREALAAVIEEQKLLDAERVEVEVREFRKEMLISRYFDEFLKQNATDSAIKNYYESNAETYEEKKVHVAHILLRTNRGMSEAERQAKLTAARDVHAKLQAGAPFAQLAAEYSEDKVSGRKGGDLGWLKDGSIDPKFSKQIFSMGKGEVSEPFETSFGFHIVQVLDAPQVVKRPFRSVAGDIRYQLRGKAKDAEMERLEKLIEVKRKEPYQPSKAPAPDPSGNSSVPDKKASSHDGKNVLPANLVSASGRPTPLGAQRARPVKPGPAPEGSSQPRAPDITAELPTAAKEKTATGKHTEPAVKAKANARRPGEDRAAVPRAKPARKAPEPATPPAPVKPAVAPPKAAPGPAEPKSQEDPVIPPPAEPPAAAE